MSGTRRLSRADRQVLRESQKEAVGSAVMSGVCDNYLAAFAIFLNASAQQVGWVVAVPQLLGAWAQLLSVWVARRGVRRRLLIVGGAAFQSVTIAVFMALCARTIDHTIAVLIVTAMLFQAGGHFVQPQWRSVMIMFVPIERRGRYFAHHARISAIASFAALAAGGLLLHVAKLLDATAVGFAVLFACALFGRIASVRLLLKLPDVEVEPEARAKSPFAGAGREIRRTLELVEYRRFIVFVAMMHGAVAVSGLRPPGSELAIFSAVHAVTSGLAIFAGATLGGVLAAHLPANINLGGMEISFAKPLYGVFACSALLRLSVVLWFAPRVAEIRLSSSATINEVMIRMARINPVTGVVMDIIGAVRKRR